MKEHNNKNNCQSDEIHAASSEAEDTGVDIGNNEEHHSLEQEESCREQLIRVQADFANYKRRMELERTTWAAAAQARVIQEFLDVVDDINRALESVEGKDDSLTHGLELIKKNVLNIFEKLGVKRIDCSGNFDPQYHEALLYVDSQEHDSGAVVEVLRPGYLLQDRVLRHAQVSVAR